VLIGVLVCMGCCLSRGCWYPGLTNRRTTAV
jgi:hypothetical protein